MIILLIGPSGSGKDTQSELLQKDGFKMISSGEILRERAKKDDELGRKITVLLNDGKLIPNDIIYAALEDEIEEMESDDIVLNGVVRDYEQVDLLNKLLERKGKKLDKVLYFKLEKPDAIERLLKRKRKDDNMHDIENRMEWFFGNIDKILNDYKEQRILIEIDASKSIEEVHEEILNKLNHNK